MALALPALGQGADAERVYVVVSSEGVVDEAARSLGEALEAAGWTAWYGFDPRDAHLRATQLLPADREAAARETLAGAGPLLRAATPQDFLSEVVAEARERRVNGEGGPATGTRAMRRLLDGLTEVAAGRLETVRPGDLADGEAGGDWWPYPAPGGRTAMVVVELPVAVTPGAGPTVDGLAADVDAWAAGRSESARLTGARVVGRQLGDALLGAAVLGLMGVLAVAVGRRWVAERGGSAGSMGWARDARWRTAARVLTVGVALWGVVSVWVLPVSLRTGAGLEALPAVQVLRGYVAEHGATDAVEVRVEALDAAWWERVQAWRSSGMTVGGAGVMVGERAPVGPPIDEAVRAAWAEAAAARELPTIELVQQLEPMQRLLARQAGRAASVEEREDLLALAAAAQRLHATLDAMDEPTRVAAEARVATVYAALHARMHAELVAWYAQRLVQADDLPAAAWAVAERDVVTVVPGTLDRDGVARASRLLQRLGTPTGPMPDRLAGGDAVVAAAVLGVGACVCLMGLFALLKRWGATRRVFAVTVGWGAFATVAAWVLGAWTPGLHAVALTAAVAFGVASAPARQGRAAWVIVPLFAVGFTTVLWLRAAAWGVAAAGVLSVLAAWAWAERSPGGAAEKSA